MNMYDPAYPASSIELRQDETGRITGLDFVKRPRQLTDGIAPDELMDRAALRAAERLSAKKETTAAVCSSKPKRNIRQDIQEGELPPGWYGRKDRR